MRSLRCLSGRRAFTMVELLVVITVIGILATLTLANLNSSKDRAKVSALHSDLRNYMKAEETYYSDFSAYGAHAALLSGNYATLSPDVTVVSSSADQYGYSLTIKNPTIVHTVDQCTVTVGPGAAPGMDGVISCP